MRSTQSWVDASSPANTILSPWMERVGSACAAAGAATPETATANAVASLSRAVTGVRKTAKAPKLRSDPCAFEFADLLAQAPSRANYTAASTSLPAGASPRRRRALAGSRTPRDTPGSPRGAPTSRARAPPRRLPRAPGRRTRRSARSTRRSRSPVLAVQVATSQLIPQFVAQPPPRVVQRLVERPARRAEPLGQHVDRHLVQRQGDEDRSLVLRQHALHRVAQRL